MLLNLSNSYAVSKLPGMLCLVTLVLAATGCGGSTPAKHSAALSAAELLDILEDDLKKHDPKDFVEVDLGKYKVSRVIPNVDHAINVKFQLIAVLHSQKKDEFSAETVQYEKRIRDAVIAVVQQAEIDRLTDPTLQSLKDELVATIARVTRSRVLKDLVFSDFAMERI